jgi:hypothetical protein
MKSMFPLMYGNALKQHTVGNKNRLNFQICVQWPKMAKDK